MKKNFIYFAGRMINAEHILTIAHTEDYEYIYIRIADKDETVYTETFELKDNVAEVGLHRWTYLKDNLLAF